MSAQLRKKHLFCTISHRIGISNSGELIDMQIARRALRRAILASLACLSLLVPAALLAQGRARIQVNDYVIDAEIIPATHKLVAHAKVTVTAVDDVSIAVFELHNDLRPTKVTDAAGKALAAERVTQDSTLRI